MAQRLQIGKNAGVARQAARLLLRCACAASVCVIASSPGAQAGELGGELALSSQLVDRGLAVGASAPIAQGALIWTEPAGWSLSASAAAEWHASSISFAAATLQLSHSFALASDWEMQTSLLYYDYAARGQINYPDRAELGAYWTWRDVVALGIAVDRFFDARDDHVAGAGDITFHWPLSAHVSVSVGAGVAGYPFRVYQRYDGIVHYVGNSVRYYRYGQIGLDGNWGQWHAAIDRLATDGATQRGYLHAAPWLATISRSF